MILSNKIADNSPYTFDFNAEVARARKEYPEETKNLTFVQATSPDAIKEIKAWYRKDAKIWFKEVALERWSKETNKGFFRRVANFADDVCSYLGLMIDSRLRAAYIYSRGAGLQRSLTPGRALLFMDSKMPLTFFPDSKDKELFFSFQHELGHHVVPRENTSIANRVTCSTENTTITLRGEKIADTFSLIAGLQRGILDKADAEHLSNQRLLHGLRWIDQRNNGLAHLTSAAIGGLLSVATDFISLSPQERKELAKAHAEKLPSNVVEMENIQKTIEAFWEGFSHQEISKFREKDYFLKMREVPDFGRHVYQTFTRAAASSAKGTEAHHIYQQLTETAKRALTPAS